MKDFRVKGAFFENLKDTGPAFTGFVEIDGVKTQIALWPKTSAKGQNYLQVAEDKRNQNAGNQRRSPFQPRQQPAQAGGPRVSPQQQYHNDMDDDIPF